MDADVDDDRFSVWRDAGRPVVPSTLADAIVAFDTDEPMRAALGAVTSDVTMQLKRREWERFVTTVSDWDRSTYLPLY